MLFKSQVTICALQSLGQAVVILITPYRLMGDIHMQSLKKKRRKFAPYADVISHLSTEVTIFGFFCMVSIEV